ncbi:hypothetical protein AMATHDRAFT_154337 [Amanita thiersii Skay4041]|uniref:CCHC-type domain-containing protein n=1 Tax=Amanita thiersii Skay4041 TaxID=703135 RepID=A0A2A9NFR3_9AGAR|nr:hypothetical protein AMATHDRAFT_154337 [Amanita thiersii Skay4041]
MAVPELPTTLDKWYELVIRLDCQWRQAVAKRKMFATQGGSGVGTQTSSTQRTTPVTPAQCDPNAMQVDRNQGPIRCYNCGQTSHMACVCPNPRQQQTHLVNAWNSGMDADRDELWRMVIGGGQQAGGSGAHIEEVPVMAPVAGATTAQPPVIPAPYAPTGFQFGQ